MNSISYGAPDYKICSNLLSPHPYYVRIFPSAPCCQKHSICGSLVTAISQLKAYIASLQLVH